MIDNKLNCVLHALLYYTRHSHQCSTEVAAAKQKRVSNVYYNNKLDVSK